MTGNNAPDNITEQQRHRGKITEKFLEHGRKYRKGNKEMSEEEKIKRM